MDKVKSIAAYKLGKPHDLWLYEPGKDIAVLVAQFKTQEDAERYAEAVSKASKQYHFFLVVHYGDTKDRKELCPYFVYRIMEAI